MNGSCRRKVRITGKKSLNGEHVTGAMDNFKGLKTYPNKFKNPNISTRNPMNGHLKNTSKMPPRKHKVPRIFCFRAKK